MEHNPKSSFSSAPRPALTPVSLSAPPADAEAVSVDPSAQGLLEGMGLDGDTLAPMETDEPAAADPKAKSKLTPAMATRIKQIKPLLSGEGAPWPWAILAGVLVSGYISGAFIHLF